MFNITQCHEAALAMHNKGQAERPGASIANSPTELRSVFNKLRAKPVGVSVS